MINGKTLEQCSLEEIAAANIKTVKKELIVDLVKYLPNRYPHDKLEGIWYIDENTLGVVNDDDFAVAIKEGEVVQKILLGTTAIDGSTLYIIHLDKSLK